jgi:aminodeoxyfutalosine deaminase
VPVDNFVAALPKVDLHLHLVGSVSPAIAASLVRRHPEVAPSLERDAIERRVGFTSFAEFADAYGKITRMIADGDDVVAIVSAMAGNLAANNVRYAEITVTPLAHLKEGFAPEELSAALAAGRRAASTDEGVELAWIFDTDGELGVDAAWATLRWVLRYAPDGTIGFGLGGPERGCPRTAFKPVFDKAIAAGLHSLPHAGETDGPESVWAALRDLRAERIGHGTRSIEDPALVEHLVTNCITLEVCPTSNACTAAASVPESPIPALVAAGVCVTVATDNPGLCATDLNREYRLCHDAFGFGAAQLVAIARNGAEAAFCSATTRRRILDELDWYAAAADDVALRSRRVR